VLAADTLADLGGRLSELSPATKLALDQTLPATWSKANPVDIIGDAGPQRYRDALDAVAGDEGCDALLVMNCPTALASSEAAADVVVESHGRQKAAHKRAKPLLTNWLGDGAAAASRKRFANAGIPTFETPDGAVCGFMQLVHYKRAQDELMQTPPSLPGGLHFDRERANAIIAAALRVGRKVLSEVEAKGLLASYGVPVVRTETVAADPAAVEAVASDILAHDDACVLKILSDDISHKSDVGGVRLAIKTPQEAADAARTMLSKVHAALPKARIRGFTIQAMIVRALRSTHACASPTPRPSRAIRWLCVPIRWSGRLRTRWETSEGCCCVPSALRTRGSTCASSNARRWRMCACASSRRGPTCRTGFSPA
jgi:acetyltransferase